jgi:hypothetical protein
MMRVQIQLYGETCTRETEDSTGLTDIVCVLVETLTGLGFAREAVINTMRELVDMELQSEGRDTGQNI